MKYLFFNDAHLRIRNPIGRVDNFSESILKKIEYITIYSKKNHCEIICLGDLFDSENPSLSILNNLIKLIDRPFFSLIGNHDVFGRNLLNYEKGALGLFEKFLRVHVLNQPYETKDVMFFPYNYTDHLENLSFFNDAPKGKLNIILSHLMITPSKFFGNHLVIDDIKTNADFFICSHYHEPFIIEKGKTTFINPGGVARTKISDRDRPVQFVVLDAEKRTYDFELIPTIENPFSEDYIENHEEDRKFEKFFERVEKANFMFSSNIIEEICSELNIGKNVSDYLKNQINLLKEVRNG